MFQNSLFGNTHRTLLFLILSGFLVLHGSTPGKSDSASASFLFWSFEESTMENVRDLNTHHLFTPPSDLARWERRATGLRRQILVGSGLWPAPEKKPLHPRITGRQQGDGFTVENVALETWPGFFLCGNIYRPTGGKGPFPAIVNPHGHWKYGRLHREADVPKAGPPPEPPAPGKADLTAVGIHLARQGFVVLSYDMVGYTDTVQFDHKFADGLRFWNWGLSLSGFQLWNSIRVVDYLQSLPEVDPERIGATGASGGGTQTFLLSAVDDRIKVAVPVNMVSAYMQGGCLCENGPGLRVGTDNVEIAALTAPRPMLLIAATGDWTKNVPQEEFPAIRKIYGLYQAEKCTAVQQFNYGHNYNRESREAMYAWFRKWLKPAQKETSYQENMMEVDLPAFHVWNQTNLLPAGALTENDFFQQWIDGSQKQLLALQPKTKKDIENLRSLLQPALASSLGVNLPEVSGFSAEKEKGKGCLLIVTVKESRQPPIALLKQLTQKGILLQQLELSLPDSNSSFLWDQFFSCYNRTPLGDRIQLIVQAAVALQKESKGKVTLLGYGEAGLWTLLARGLLPFSCQGIVDTNYFDTRSEPHHLERLYAPALRRLGDLQTSAWIQAASPLALFNTGTVFQTESIVQVYRNAGTKVRVLEKEITPDMVLAWLK